MPLPIHSSTALLLLTLGACAACSRSAPEPTLTPATTREEQRVTPSVVVNDAGGSGVRVSVRSERTLEDPKVPDGVAPVFVTLENTGKIAVDVRRDGFALSSPEGGNYAAMSPSSAKSERLKEELEDRALPEGVLQPGQSISGYLYFKGVDTEATGLRFRANLPAASAPQGGERPFLPNPPGGREQYGDYPNL